MTALNKVTPIRPGLQWTPNVLYMHALPPGIRLLDVQDHRSATDYAMLSFDVAGQADALVAAGFVTHEMLASIPKSGRKVIRQEAPVDRMIHMFRRKADYRVDFCLYGDNPDIPRYVAMFSLDRKVKPRDKRAELSSRAVDFAKLWLGLTNPQREIVEGFIRQLRSGQTTA